MLADEDFKAVLALTHVAFQVLVEGAQARSLSVLVEWVLREIFENRIYW